MKPALRHITGRIATWCYDSSRLELQNLSIYLEKLTLYGSQHMFLAKCSVWFQFTPLANRRQNENQTRKEDTSFKRLPYLILHINNLDQLFFFSKITELSGTQSLFKLLNPIPLIMKQFIFRV